MASPIPPPWLVQPLDPADFDLPGSLPDPGFTQLVNNTLGDLGTPADGVDQAITDVLGLVDQLDAALGASDAALDDALTALAAADTHTASDSFTGYLETFSAGNTIVNDTQALIVPDLLELPASSAFGVGGPATIQTPTVDLGHVPLGGTVTFLIGSWSTNSKGNRAGALSVQLVNGDRTLWALLAPVKNLGTGFPSGSYSIQFTAKQPGSFTAQVNAIGAQNVPGTFGGLQIVTFTATVP